MAATVNACAQRSGASAPTVTLTTSDRATLGAYAQRGYAGGVLEIVFTSMLVLVGVFITWFAAYVVYKLYNGQS